MPKGKVKPKKDSLYCLERIDDTTDQDNESIGYKTCVWGRWQDGVRFCMFNKCRRESFKKN